MCWPKPVHLPAQREPRNNQTVWSADTQWTSRVDLHLHVILLEDRLDFWGLKDSHVGAFRLLLRYGITNQWNYITHTHTKKVKLHSNLRGARTVFLHVSKHKKAQAPLGNNGNFVYEPWISASSSVVAPMKSRCLTHIVWPLMHSINYGKLPTLVKENVKIKRAVKDLKGDYWKKRNTFAENQARQRCYL